MALFLFTVSCKEEDDVSFSSNDNSNLQSESSLDAQFEDIADMSNVVMVADNGTLDGNRTTATNGVAKNIKDAITDARFNCATVELTFAPDNDPNAPNPIIHGYILIDFGTGCVGPNGRTRKGRIHIEFGGRRFMTGSYVKITTEDFFVDGIRVDGERTDTNITGSTEDAPSFDIDEDITLTFPDGTTASRSSIRQRVWTRASDPLNDTWTITGGAVGKTRRGKDYTMTILKPLVYKRDCALQTKVVMPVEGTKEIVAETKKVTLDFGTGACDTKVTITVNGRSKEIEISADGN